MDYLTNYYKNLSEQLQEKLNILEAQINEGRYNPETGKIESVSDPRTRYQERKPKVQGTKPDLSKIMPSVPTDTDTDTPGTKPVSIIPQSTTLNTTNTTQQSQNTPLEKDTIKNFVQSILAGKKPGEKIKKTPSNVLYRDDDEIDYIQ
jgi:hypothetical protein